MCQPYLEMPFGEGDAWEAHGARGCRGARFPRGSMRSTGQIGSGGHLHAPPLSNFPKGEKSFFTNPLLANGVKTYLPSARPPLQESLFAHLSCFFHRLPFPSALLSRGWGVVPFSSADSDWGPLLAPRWLSVGCPLLGGCWILGPPPGASGSLLHCVRRLGSA